MNNFRLKLNEIFSRLKNSISMPKMLKLKKTSSWKLDKKNLEDWKNNWRTHLSNLPNTISQISTRVPKDFRLSKNATIYINCSTIAIVSYFAADLVSTLVAPLFPEPPAKKVIVKYKANKGIEQYNEILVRNLFNKDGLIPDTESDGMDPNAPPVRTSLPLELMGIILLRDNLKSVASVLDRSRNDVVAVKVNDRINPQAIVVSIDEDKIVFINKGTNRKEFIDLPEEVKKLKIKSLGGKGAGVTKVDETHMIVERSEVDKALANLNLVLTQARCVPNSENGKSAGFRCFQIVPGSIYDKIGIQNGDVVLAINGSELSDPGQAFELFNQLKNSSSVEISLKRNMQTMNIRYDIQ